MSKSNLSFSLQIQIFKMVLLKSDVNASEAASYSESILTDLKLQTLFSHDSATLLMSGGDSVFVHTPILRTASHLLSSLLCESTGCESNPCIILPDSPSSTLNSLVSLLYTGSASYISEEQSKCVSILSELIGIRIETQTLFETDQTDFFKEEECDLRATLLNVETLVRDKKTGSTVQLCFPKSRVKRFASNIETEGLSGFNGRVQKEYNQHPVGQYMGPYDQNEKLILSVQLPDTNLDHQSYTEFCHNGEKCYQFCIKSYEKYDEYSKIGAYRIKDAVGDLEDSNSDESDAGEKYYTCQSGRCKIPCPCPQCCSNRAQCTEHNLQHPALFDEKKHAISIRSSSSFCLRESFFQNSYILRYSGIPLNCKKCSLDLLYHHSYHFDFHEACRFCKLTLYKLKATTRKEHHQLEKSEANYYKTVCPHCNERFRDAYDAKKHMEFKHKQKVLFECEHCTKRFQSNQAKQYHEMTKHTESENLFACGPCDKKFASLVNLKNHKKFVHSDLQNCVCKECGEKFKQNRDLSVHMLKAHDINQRTEDYLENSENKIFRCKDCSSTFQYQKNLNAHVKVNHLVEIKKFQCKECPSEFKYKTTLLNHQRVKHEHVKQKFFCPVCTQGFTEKRTMKRHEQKH